ncbi:testis-specific serine/threonine-protein kinase 5-like isoform X3 [Sceloporus undulatus]|uniref:testis-specific serine/threonine-protein kinase 5-like isoform X3 n=1 Tax=Sceloporus undulatus TaxID=8520 RepID=UPI001C4D7AA3|nr:testis-specific serine/threonine-protein kinase 5-like isoform X3 [Sceloporus undulatus]
MRKLLILDGASNKDSRTHLPADRGPTHDKLSPVFNPASHGPRADVFVWTRVPSAFIPGPSALATAAALLPTSAEPLGRPLFRVVGFAAMKSFTKREADRRTFLEQVRESKENGYLLSSKKIGSGAFSKVYLGYATQEKMMHNYKLASDLRSKRHSMVAIKIISTAEAPVEYTKKFLPREIYSLNVTYKHLNVIQLYEMYRNSKRTYLVLELASRGDLLEHINATSDRREFPGLEEEEARRLFRQIVSAVAHCHNVGIVHRDLKCENILLDERGFIKLTDFGFANRYSLKNSLMSTFCGSVAYTAPEILMSKKYNGELADLWSLGVILYAMVTGKLPFKERQPHKMIHVIKQGLAFRQPVSPECQNLIEGLLQLKPASRLGLQQVATHRWMLPATSAIFHRVMSSMGVHPECKMSQEKSQVTQGETGSSKSQLPGLDSTVKASEGPAKEAKPLSATTPVRASSATGAFAARSKVVEKRSPESPVTTNCILQLPSPRKTERPPRLSLYRPSLLTTLQPFHHLPNFRKPGSGFSTSAYVTSKRLGDKVPARAAALSGGGSSSLSKQVHSLYTMTPCP